MKNVFFLLAAIILLFSLINSRKHVSEAFNEVEKYAIDMPLTTKTECRNVCSPPTGRCFITGEQCSTDAGCYGCKPVENKSYYSQEQIISDEDSGKSSYISSYSSLTSDITRGASLITESSDSPPSYNQGKNEWKTSFDAGQEIFNKQYYEPNMSKTEKNQQQNYTTRNSATGEFKETGPLPANFYSSL